MAASVTPGARLPQLAKYEVLEEIGHGGMATVYRAKDPRLGREVAVKVIHPHLRDSIEVAARFVTEAHAVAKLRHPNIVEVFDVSGEDDRERYLVVELLRGETLRALLKQRGALPPEVAAAMALELLAAVAHAHAEGIVHRDVKPENVLVEIGDGDGDGAIKIKLTDFGIAKLLDEKGVTSTGQVLGSPAHMAPEQIEGGAIDARSDVFGMGVLLYEAMVGHLPFEGNNPAQVLRRVLDGQYPPADIERPTVGKKFSLILDLALAHSQDDRYPSAKAMRDALAAELERLGVGDPKKELREYLHDPEGYVAKHEKRTVEKLCALGAAARKAERALDAAADYNRALAYAPSDPTLMKIVGGMHRAEARARMIKRVAPLVLGAVVACLLAFGMAKWLRARGNDVVPDPTPSTSSSVVASASASVPTVASVTPSTSATVIASAPTAVRSVAIPTTTTSAANPTTITRTITFVNVRPANGVTVIIDDGSEESLSSGSTFTVDGNAHKLRFQCVKNACEAESRTVGAGKTDESIPAVELHFKAATLIVLGAPGATYHIDDFPSLTIKPNDAVSIPVSEYRKNVMVYDVANAGDPKPVTLVAGQQANVKF